MNLKLRLSYIRCLIPVCFLLTACNGAKNKDIPKLGDQQEIEQTDSLKIYSKYAEGFKVRYLEDGTILLDIQDPEGREAQIFNFALIDKKIGEGTVPEGYIRIDVPVQRVICMTSLQLSNFDKLGELDKIAGITSTRHLFNPEMRKRLEEGKTHKIGIEGNFDNEVIMAINPDLIMISPFKRGGYDAIKNVDTPLLPHLGYKELTPLGQAEWIKVTGLLTGTVERANEIFSGIEDRYLKLKALADTTQIRPTIFTGQMQGGHWYAVGGNSFLAQIFRDAGADYILKDNIESGGVTLDYEKIYHDAANADYWRIVNSFDGNYSYDALKAEDSRYADFKAWKEKKVIYCNMRQVPFYETMPVEPEVVLADFIAIFHPEILSNHQPRYYQLMK